MYTYSYSGTKQQQQQQLATFLGQKIQGTNLLTYGFYDARQCMPYRDRLCGCHHRTGVFVLAIYLPVSGSVNFDCNIFNKGPNLARKYLVHSREEEKEKRKKRQDEAKQSSTQMKAEHTTRHIFSHESHNPHPIAFSQQAKYLRTT